MRFRRSSGDGLDEFQPRLWLVLIGLVAMFGTDCLTYRKTTTRLRSNSFRRHGRGVWEIADTGVECWGGLLSQFTAQPEP